MSELDIIRGTLDVLILKSISGDPQHGYAVAQWIRKTSGETLLIEEGALYPALHRLARKGWVSSEWGVSENNRRAKFYRLTPKGRQALQTQETSWNEYVRAMSKVMASDPVVS